MDRSILCFRIHDQRFAIPLEFVERVIMAQTITVIPDSPGILQGVFDYHGSIIPVISLRYRFSWEERQIKVTDRLIVSAMAGRLIAFVVDEVEGVSTIQQDYNNEAFQAGFGLAVRCIVQDEKGIILIFDLEKLINHVEQIEIEQIVRKIEMV